MAKALKSVFNVQSIDELSRQLAQTSPGFNQSLFVERVFQPEWDDLSLLQRIAHVSESVHEVLNLPYVKALPILKRVAPHFCGIFHWVFPDYVARYGLSHYECSMQALAEFTRFSTSEYAIRVFLHAKPQPTLEQMIGWCSSDDAHLRRLASEGVRPRLPWAKHLPWIADRPEIVLPIIEALKSDESAYVRKSVANLLNDLSKQQPDWVLALCTQWHHEGESLSKQTEWIIRHGLRTLLKKGDSQALSLLGYKRPHPLMVKSWQCDSRVKRGQRLHFFVEMQSFDSTLGKMRLEYALTFKRKHLQGYRKVFKLAEGDYRQSCKKFNKQHSFEKITTRSYYPGTHAIELLVNGVMLAASEFELID
ncbi:DNA alkylation repair protein [Thiomicrorhabdus chilensis]|uniref:DNA alkylation repair protein n=1 Tax=Thiomicrorhabdus chilensis TaxID=63656 RepID=UPI0004282DFB|nr:DNA alkylation repair protein [Thiomicrorhabdus chilensis]